MSSPHGTPSEPVSALRLTPQAGDAAAQTGELGRTTDQPYTIHSEAIVSGTDQDVSRTGAPDAASGLATLRSSIANTPASGPVFTGDGD